MPFHREGTSRVIRLVRGVSGEVEMQTDIMLRFDYGLIVPWVTRLDPERIQAVAGPDMAVPESEVLTKARGMKHSGILSYAKSSEPPPSLVS